MKFRDGTEVTKENWSKRADEIRKLYEYYIYGVWHDSSEVDVSYKMNDGGDGRKTMTVTVTRESTSKSGSFEVSLVIPTASDTLKMSEGGWPYIIGLHPGQEAIALSRGYAFLSFAGGGFFGGVTNIAGDYNSHTGLFYDLYPYGEDWKEQTGELLAWSWGVSRIIDALENGAAKEINLNDKNSMVTGVSRYGKAAMVCGAFEKRIKMAAPACSGAGGVAMFRYNSEGKVYDFSLIKESKEYAYGRNEPLDSLRATGEQGWFNNNKFSCFKDPKALPVDQHMLATLCADPERYLFIIAACAGDRWSNAPGMWLTYRAAKASYEKLGLGDHIVANFHQTGHTLTEEDMNYMIGYFNEKVYGIKSERDLTCLTTSVFEAPVNKDPIFDSFGGTVPPQAKQKEAPARAANPAGSQGGQRPAGGMGGFGGQRPASGQGGFGGQRPAGGQGGFGF